MLDLAITYPSPPAKLTLDVVHRFEDPAYAELSLLMRRGERTGEVFDRALARGQIRIHATDVERRQALTLDAGLIIADTHQQVDALNTAIHQDRVSRGEVDPRGAVTTSRGERIGVGDKIATRRNDRDLGVANRDTWTVTAVHPHGRLELVGEDGRRRALSPEYVHGGGVELAYASTVYGAQGQTVDTAHVVIGDHTNASAACVAMTRGRRHNTAHIVADSVTDARAQWTTVFARDGADLGPSHAARMASQAVETYGPTPGRRAVSVGPLSGGPARHRPYGDPVSANGPDLGR